MIRSTRSASLLAVAVLAATFNATSRPALAIVAPGDILVTEGSVPGTLTQFTPSSPAATNDKTFTSTLSPAFAYTLHGNAITGGIGKIVTTYSGPTSGILTFNAISGALLTNVSTTALTNPTDITAFSDGNLAVTNNVAPGLAFIDMFNAGDALTAPIPVSGASPSLTGAAIAPDGSFWVVDQGDKTLLQYAEAGGILMSVSSVSTSSFTPVDLAITGTGAGTTLWVLDTSGVVHPLTSTGSSSGSNISSGAVTPASVAVASDNSLYVSDSNTASQKIIHLVSGAVSSIPTFAGVTGPTALTIVPGGAVVISSATWAADVASANWNTASDWSPGVPNGVGVSASFLSAVTQLTGITISLGSAITLGSITFDNPHEYMLDATGTSLTLQNTGTTAAQITVNSGSHAINNGTLNLSSPTTINTNGVNTFLFVGSSVTSSGGLTKTGTGTLFLAGTDFGINGTTINEGLLAYANPRPAGDRLVLNSAPLTGYNQSHAIFRGDYAHIDSYRTQLLAGYNSDNWNGTAPIGTSIITSTTATFSNAQAIGYTTGADYLALEPGGNPLFNTVVQTVDLLLRYTYEGDANLDGKITAADYAQIDSGFLLGNYDGITNIAHWVNGDFNYDGVVNYKDYELIDAGLSAYSLNGPLAAAEIAEHAAIFGQPYLQLLAADGISLPASVPEPCTLLLVGLPLLTALGRRPNRLLRASASG